MIKTFRIERDGVIRFAAFRQMAHDTPIVVGGRVKYGTGRMWFVLSVCD